MLSRTAGHWYWMSRYLERAESTARLLDVNLSLSLDPQMLGDEAWTRVIATTGDLDAFTRLRGAVTPDSAAAFLALDPLNPNSVASCAQFARENARAVREYLPDEAWEAVNALHLMLRASQGGDGPGRLVGVLEAARLTARQIDGLLGTSLLRDEAWHFHRLGQNLERADQTSRLVDVQDTPSPGADEAVAESRWEAVARSAGALAMYRRRHGGTQGPKMAEFLLLDGAFPRSPAFCLGAAEEALRAINGTPAGMFANAAEKSLARLAADLRTGEIEEILGQGLHEWLDRFQLRLNAVGDGIQRFYFEPPAVPAPAAEPPQAQQ